MAASRDVNLDRIKLEAKKELLLSIAGLPSFEQKKCPHYGNVCCATNIFYNSENRVLKTLMAQLPIYCKYKSNGCQEILMKEDMIKHEQGCVYRPIFCADLNCTQTSTYHGLLEHITQVHKGLDVIEKKKFIITSKVGVDLKPEKLATTRISAFDFTFFEAGAITDQFMFKWIYILGDPEVAKNFCYHVKVSNGVTEHTSNEVVQSVSEHFNDITKSFKAFFLPIVRVKEFLDKNSQMVLEYQIRNMKEDAKDDNEESGISDDNE